jgi:hypothetical protein
MGRSKQLESYRGSSRQLKLLTPYLPYIQETTLHIKEKFNCTVNKHITQKNNNYHMYVYNLGLYNSKLTIAGCAFYDKIACQY